MKRFVQQYRDMSRVLRFGIVVFFGIGAVARVLAQEREGDWTTPVNLSNSGAITSPVMAMGADRELHVFWQDLFEGFVYTTGDGDIWSQPEALRLPFSEPPFSLPTDVDDLSTANIDEGFQALYAPLIVIDADSSMHAFWQDGRSDLLYSQVAVPGLKSPAAWTAPRLLADAVLAQSVAIGLGGRLHLAYITMQSTEGSPAGVYYLQSGDGGTTWTEPLLLYGSNYLRSITTSQANIQIRVDSGGNIHLVWDEPLLDTVFYTRSTGGGLAWETPVEIDRRQAEDAPGAAGPAKISVTTMDDTVHLTWQAQHQDSNCIQYHQASENGGRTWQPRQVAFQDARGCPTASHILVGFNDMLLLLTSVGNDAFIQASDGEQWSKPLIQSSLSRFTHPDTFRDVDLACLQFEITKDEHLLVVGCGTGSGDDVWTLKRTLYEVENWIVPEEIPVWSPPATLVSNSSKLSSPALVAGTDGRFHAFWIGTDETASSDSEMAIYYSRRRGTRSTRPAPVFTGKIDQLAAAIGNQGRLFLVWRDSDSGSLLFSRVEVDEAVFPMRWTVPAAISSPNSAIGRPEIHMDETGKLHVAYAVTVNEERGIYLVQSDDRGASWTEPVSVFDGAAAGWELVESPRLASSADNTLHLLWLHRSLSPGSRPLELYYARSEDGGRRWSPPELVAENPTGQYHIVGIGERNVIRVWQEINQDTAVLWYQESLDNGRTWSPSSLIPGFGDLFGVTVLVGDVANQLHLVQVMNDAGSLVLREWLWQADGWISNDEHIWSTKAAAPATELVAAIAADGQLAVVYPGIIPNTDSDGSRYELFYTSRFFDLLPVQPTLLPTVAPTIEPSPSVVPTRETMPTPTMAFSLTPNASRGLQLGPIDAGTTTGGLIVGVIPAGLAVLIVVGFGLYLTKRKRY